MSGVRLLDNWSPPDGAGDPIAALATTFTFDADFFAQDCLTRFLSLSTVSGEGDRISSIAAVLEEEDRLSEAQVTVLIDRSSPAEKRNLRWDVVPVEAPGGLLHAKVVVLIWERAARVVVGSANLTPAGYRRQVEATLAFDLDPDCQVPSSVFDDIATELRRVVDLVPASGARDRAESTIDLLEARVADLGLGDRQPADVRIAVAPARPGNSPLGSLDDVWRGGRPLSATVLSPFWDGDRPSPAIAAVRDLLTGRPAARRSLTAVVEVDPFVGIVRAPASMADETGLAIRMFDGDEAEPRGLHAKVLLIESDDWIAAMVGSSNATSAGLGLHATRGHVELNVWIGCPSGSALANVLRALVPIGDPLEPGADEWDPAPDEDEPTTPPLHPAFRWCTVKASPPPSVSLEIDWESAPTDFRVSTPGGGVLLDASSADGSPQGAAVEVTLPDAVLPSYLVVRWSERGETCVATWAANIDDRTALPPPADLADLPVEVLLAALASSRPLPRALEDELRRREQSSDIGDRGDELDPLKRFDSSGLLLQRTRHLSLALWRLSERLSRPVTSLDVLRWRLHGVIGPVSIADGLLAAARDDRAVPGESNFLLAELALTVANVDWASVAPSIPRRELEREIHEVLEAIDRHAASLPVTSDEGLARYVADALAEARA